MRNLIMQNNVYNQIKYRENVMRGTVTAVNNNGTYSVRFGCEDQSYPFVPTYAKNSNLQIGDRVTVLFEGRNREMPKILAFADNYSEEDNRVKHSDWDIAIPIVCSIENATYNGISKNVSAQDYTPYGLAFSADGSKMYMVGHNDIVYQYNLSTAWDVSTAIYANIHKDVSAQDTTPQDVAFNSDGSKMFIFGRVNDAVYQYTLSTPWNVSTASYDTGKRVNAQDSSPYNIAFKSDGSKIYVLGKANDTVYQYTLSTAWDIITRSYDGISKNVNAQETNPYGLAFNSDGSKMFIVGNNDTVYQYTLSTPWNVGTASYDNISKNVNAQEGWPYAIVISSDCSKMYIMGINNDTVYQYKNY